MCFIRIDIFTRSLWLMNKRQLQNNHQNKIKREKCWPPVHKTNEAWGQFTSNSIQHINGKCNLCTGIFQSFPNEADSPKMCLCLTFYKITHL